jgi:hypothetical protein
VNKFEEPKKSKKEIEAEKQAELALIFKPVVDAKQNATGSQIPSTSSSLSFLVLPFLFSLTSSH